ncbi:MAG TPA: medium chain dehydrogenase/reductase family protein, partial [Opitutaceae bacterium]
ERIFISRKGDPSVLKLISDEVGPPRPDEVLIRIKAAGVSFADVMVREGIYPGVKLPVTPGYDVVGDVEAVGDGVRDFRKGDRVAAMTVVGGYSRYLSVPAKHVVRVPQEVESGAAVSMVLNYLTAYQMIKRCTHMVAGDSILVHGAAGGVGTALLQIASIEGLKAFGTASGGKLHQVEQLGGVPIDYTKADFVARIQRDTQDGVSAAFDFVAGAHAKRSYQALRSTGTLVCYGAFGVTTNGHVQPLKALITLLRDPSFKPIGLLGDNKGCVGYNTRMWRDSRPEMYAADLGTLFALLKEGRIAPVIGARFPLQNAADAHLLLNRRGVTGKIVLDC